MKSDRLFLAQSDRLQVMRKIANFATDTQVDTPPD